MRLAFRAIRVIRGSPNPEHIRAVALTAKLRCSQADNNSGLPFRHPLGTLIPGLASSMTPMPLGQLASQCSRTVLGRVFTWTINRHRRLIVVVRPSKKICYSMTLNLELDEQQARRLQEVASRLNVSVNDLARAAINDLLAKPDDDFERAAERVLKKNVELYKRLA